MRIFLLLMTLLTAATPALAAKTILVFGDSLSAGYGIRPEQAWPALLDIRLKEKRLDYSVANLSISGETSAGGRSRLPAALKQHQPALVVIALGANDGLRGLALKQLQDNLEAMIEEARTVKAQVVLVGMRLPPNYGPYADQFNQLFTDIARKKKIPLVKFLLDGIGDQPGLFQADQLHPTAVAQPRLLDNVWPALTPLLKKS
ncbi:MAG TPA: arylesterase [Rhodocyclaceae bacterium]|nr:arylesterase [Rhodocyclaceae bacterium]